MQISPTDHTDEQTAASATAASRGTAARSAMPTASRRRRRSWRRLPVVSALGITMALGTVAAVLPAGAAQAAPRQQMCWYHGWFLADGVWWQGWFMEPC